jgi:hypothetical protein
MKRFVASAESGVRDQVNAGSTTFLGYDAVSVGITGLAIRAAQNPGAQEGIFPAINDLAFAAVAEPSSADLMLAGMLLLGTFLAARRSYVTSYATRAAFPGYPGRRLTESGLEGSHDACLAFSAV